MKTPLRLIFGGGGDDEDEYEVLPPEESLAHARHVLARLYGAGETGAPDVAPDRCDVRTRVHFGLCGECGRRALARFQLGAYQLCRECLRRRRNAADMAADKGPAGEVDRGRAQTLATGQAVAEREGRVNTERQILADCQELVDEGAAVWVETPTTPKPGRKPPRVCHLCQRPVRGLVASNGLFWCPPEETPECNFTARGRLRVPLGIRFRERAKDRTEHVRQLVEREAVRVEKDRRRAKWLQARPPRKLTRDQMSSSSPPPGWSCAAACWSGRKASANAATGSSATSPSSRFTT